MSNPSGEPRPVRFRPSEHVVSSRLGDSGVLVHLRTNQIFELNQTGVRVWELIGEGLSVIEIARRLQGEFDVDAAQVRVEVDALVDALAGQGLVDVDDAA